MASPNEKEIEALANLWKVPFIAAKLGHRQVKSVAIYAHNGKLWKAYLRWFDRQNEQTWSELKHAWGGDEAFDEIVRILSDTALGRLSRT